MRSNKKRDTHLKVKSQQKNFISVFRILFIDRYGE